MSSIPKEELKIGGIYAIRCRNLLTGAWNGHTFVGIRLKFDYRYLDEEVLNDPPSRGTVTQVLEYLGDVPDGISLESGWSTVKGWKSNEALFKVLEKYPHG